MLERYQEAVMACKELRRLMPDSARALAMLGNAMSHCREYDTSKVSERWTECFFALFLQSMDLC